MHDSFSWPDDPGNPNTYSLSQTVLRLNRLWWLRKCWNRFKVNISDEFLHSREEILQTTVTLLSFRPCQLTSAPSAGSRAISDCTWRQQAGYVRGDGVEGHRARVCESDSFKNRSVTALGLKALTNLLTHIPAGRRRTEAGNFKWFLRGSCAHVHFFTEDPLNSLCKPVTHTLNKTCTDIECHERFCIYAHTRIMV